MPHTIAVHPGAEQGHQRDLPGHARHQCRHGGEVFAGVGCQPAVLTSFAEDGLPHEWWVRRLALRLNPHVASAVKKVIDAGSGTGAMVSASMAKFSLWVLSVL